MFSDLFISGLFTEAVLILVETLTHDKVSLKCNGSKIFDIY